MRPFTLICLVLAACSGLYLYQAKHRARLLDHAIGDLVHQADQARARTGLLQAEWALLNDTERLGQLAGKYLPLRPTTPNQFTVLADLAQRLPPIHLTKPPTPIPTQALPDSDENQPPPLGAALAASASSPSPSSSPAPATSAPAVSALDKPRPAPVASTAMAHSAPLSVDHALKPALAEVALRHVGTLETRVATHPAVLAAAGFAALSRPIAALTAPSAASAAFRPGLPIATAPTPVAMSALGMARTMLPLPLPFAAPRTANPADAHSGG